MSPLLTVSDLSIHTGERKLVSNVSFSIDQGSRMGLIGESGSGKTLTALAVMGLLPARIQATGSILLDNHQVVGAPESRLVPIRGTTCAVVFQEPLTALDPIMRVGRQLAEPLARSARRAGSPLSRKELQDAIRRALEEVALPDPDRICRAYPYELSGGQRQRVALAMAIGCRPKLLIADEPTTALDVTIQAEILSLLDRLIRERGMALLLIGHDLPVVTSVVDEVTVLRDGVAVEQGSLKSMLTDPKHEYTRELIDAARAFDTALEDPA